MEQVQTLQLYSPHSKQLEFHNSTARYRVAALGRQSGKSTMCVNELVKKAWENPGSTFWFVSPTYSQALVQYRRMVGMLYSHPELMIKKNQSELRVKLKNQSQIRFVSGDSYQNLRGETLHGAIIDEVRDQSPDLWPMVIRPMLTTTRGWAAFVSTPNGLDNFYDLFERGAVDDNWESFQAPSTCNPLFTQEELLEAQATMSEAVFAQEIMAAFRDIHNGSVYINYGVENLRTSSPFSSTGALYSPYLPLLVGMDFNLSPMSWVMGQERAGDFYFHDEIYLERSHTQEASAELVARIKKHDIKAETKVILVGDASSKAGQRAAFGRSDLSIVKDALTMDGISFVDRTPDSNPRVSDRVNVVNSKLKSAVGTNHLWIHPDHCPKAKRDLMRVIWKRGAHANPTLDQTSDPTLTHMSDAIGYPICVLSKQWAPSVGKMRVISRG